MAVLKANLCARGMLRGLLYLDWALRMDVMVTPPMLHGFSALLSYATAALEETTARLDLQSLDDGAWGLWGLTGSARTEPSAAKGLHPMVVAINLALSVFEALIHLWLVERWITWSWIVKRVNQESYRPREV